MPTRHCIRSNILAAALLATAAARCPACLIHGDGDGDIVTTTDAVWLEELNAELFGFRRGPQYQADAPSHSVAEAQRMGAAPVGTGDAELRRSLRENWEGAMWQEI